MFLSVQNEWFLDEQILLFLDIPYVQLQFVEFPFQSTPKEASQNIQRKILNSIIGSNNTIKRTLLLFLGPQQVSIVQQ